MILAAPAGMKKIIVLLLSLCALCIATEAAAQHITDSGYRTVGHIKSDGTIQDASYKIVGHLKDDKVQDASYRIIGHIKDDGTIQDASYRIIGHVKSDGTVQDASYRIIGHAKDIPLRWAAFYFFFRQ